MNSCIRFIQDKAENLNAQIREFEAENQRLQRELLQLQERNNEQLRNVQNQQKASDIGKGTGS